MVGDIIVGSYISTFSVKRWYPCRGKYIEVALLFVSFSQTCGAGREPREKYGVTQKTKT